MRLSDVAVLPEPDDNVAIVSRRLEPGTELEIGGTPVTLAHTVLEGHRLVVRPIAVGEPLLSWTTPFARARRDLIPGDYVCTPSSLELVRGRGVDGLPDGPSADNVPLDPYRLDETALLLGDQVPPVDRPATFLGFRREQGPAGTRNHVVLVATSSRSSAFVTELARRFDGDLVVPVAHTEGGEDGRPNNLGFLLATLAGFCVHPNAGAVLVVDAEGEPVTGEMVRAALPAELRVPHAFFTRRAGFESDLAAAAEVVRGWLPAVAAQRRTEVPLSDLRVALQCGGSDAFSGISANPLAGAVVREVIRHGGAGVLAETDELIGAEEYVLKNVRDVATARKFVETVESFKERVGWHGHTAEGNPSGGNVYRGLYNIVLKSVGAARKLDRALRLDHVIGYGEPLPGPGFTFMDSPGNDLESVAGQVASGCNLIFFTTGNGSITNFPFVPTLKFVTTTPRYELLQAEMDVDAGRYLTGTPMDELTVEVFDLTVATASGRPSAGERAGHSQVSIWREWRQTSTVVATDDDRDTELPGTPLPVAGIAGPRPAVDLLAADGRRTPEQLALILPTSLCSGQIALRLAAQAETERWCGDGVTRVVALPHTEGCGSSGGASEETYARTMVGYLTHPNVRLALLLEHGCEKTHNDYFRSRLVEAGADPSRYGWASIQADGGIDAVTARVRDWFTGAGLPAPTPAPGGLGDLTVGLDARGDFSDATAEAFALLGSWIVGAGGTVLLPWHEGPDRPRHADHNGPIGGSGLILRALYGDHWTQTVEPTLAHGQRPAAPGWQVMRMPGRDWMETATGLGAGGAQVLLTHVTGGTVSAQRFVPVVQVSADPATAAKHGDDLDGVLAGTPEEQARAALATLVAVASRRQVPKAVAVGNVGFQITRGLLGTSM